MIPGKPPFENKLRFDAPLGIDDGYGHAAEKIIMWLDRLGVDMYSTTAWGHTRLVGVHPRVQQIAQRGLHVETTYGIRMSTPPSFNLAPGSVKIGFSMWEFIPFPQAWVAGTNMVAANFVPCEQNKQLWIEAGCTQPVYVIPLGADVEVYQYYERPPRETFTFVMAGTLSARKNPNMVVEAFLDLFKDVDDVYLYIKSAPYLAHGFNFDKIKVINDLYEEGEMAEMYKSCDVFVYPSQGEGWGMSPCEAMATGIPAIAPAHSGMAEYMTDEIGYPIRFEPTRNIVGSGPELKGQQFGFAVIKIEDLKELMWHCYKHRDEVREKGKKAAQRMRERFTWEITARRILEILR